MEIAEYNPAIHGKDGGADKTYGLIQAILKRVLATLVAEQPRRAASEA
jgi:hypothetical protein